MQQSRHTADKPAARRRTSAAALVASALGALGLLTLGAAAQAQTRYLVTLNTRTLNTTSGGLDFQFNPGGSGTSTASVQVTGFTTNGTLVGASSDSGSATGALPGTLGISNSPGINEVFQGVTFGTTLSFALTFTSPDPTPVGSLFAFTLFDNSGSQLLSNNPDGSVLDISVNPDGSLTPQPAPPGANGLTVTPAPVPEASPALSLGLLLALGGGAMAVRRRKAAGAR